MHRLHCADDTVYLGLETVKLMPQRATDIIEIWVIVLNEHD